MIDPRNVSVVVGRKSGSQCDSVSKGQTMKQLRANTAWTFCLIKMLGMFKVVRGLTLAGAATLFLVGLATPPAYAQLAPGKPIRIIVPFGPAGSADVIARILQVPLGQALKQTIIIENRAGAGSNLGSVAVARSDPDGTGTTLLLTTSAFLANPALYKNVPYDPAKDFTPVADLAVSPNIIATQPKGAFASLADVVARARPIRRS
jgi:tripartite-type tricarboxylate transporter receptor subunit TctC